jgi:hypothetical protein
METMMTNLFAMYGSDKNLETKGKWIVLGPDENATAFLIARAGGANTKFSKLLAEKLRPWQKLIQHNARKPTQEVLDIITKMQKETFVEACLLDWRNVRIEESGENVPYSPEAAFKLFDQLPDLFLDLFNQADQVQTFQHDSLEDEAGN